MDGVVRDVVFVIASSSGYHGNQWNLTNLEDLGVLSLKKNHFLPISCPFLNFWLLVDDINNNAKQFFRTVLCAHIPPVTCS